jgi:hypothetical protein
MNRTVQDLVGTDADVRDRNQRKFSVKLETDHSGGDLPVPTNGERR